MSMKPGMSALPRASKAFEKNVWADFVELLCLVSKDKEISLSDLVEVARQEDPEHSERGDQESAEKEDSFRQQLSDVFSYLLSRKQSFGDFYPFSFVDEDTICVEQTPLSSGQKLYLFLLYASNLSRFTKSEQARLTKDFEALSKAVIKLVFPQFNVEIFGTASQEGEPFHGGNVFDRLQRLSQYLNTTLSDAALKNPRYRQAGGDAGIDLVGFAQIEAAGSHAPFVPTLFAQCACSVDEWKDKQFSIQYEKISKKFSNLASYCEFIIVPFSLRGTDGSWSYTDLDRIVVIPIDRVRFLHIISLYGESFSFFENNDAYALVTDSLEEII